MTAIASHTFQVELNGKPVRAASFATEENGGIQWSAVVSADDWPAAEIAPDYVWNFLVKGTTRDGDGAVLDEYTWESPNLVCPDTDEACGRQGKYVTLRGVDEVSYRLTQTGKALNTINDHMAQNIMTSIGALVGVTVNYPSTIDWRIEHFDVLGDTPVGDHIARICRDGALRFRPGKTGGLDVMDWEADSPSEVPAPMLDSWTRVRRKSKAYSKAVLALQRRYKAQYVFPVDTPSAERQEGDLSPGLDMSTVTATSLVSGGAIQAAEFFNASEELCGYILLDTGSPPGPTPGAAGPAAKVAFNVLAPVSPAVRVWGNLVITGRPPSAYTYDAPAMIETDEIAGLRSRVLRIESTLWDTHDLMEARKDVLLAAANSDTDVIEMAILPDPRYWAGDTLSFSSTLYEQKPPDVRIVSTSWTVSNGRPSMTLTTHVLPE